MKDHKGLRQLYQNNDISFRSCLVEMDAEKVKILLIFITVILKVR